MLVGIAISGVVGYYSLVLLDKIFIRRRLSMFAAYVIAPAVTILIRRAL